MFVNKILSSVYFWLAIGILGLLVWITKGKPSKLIEIFKLLGTLFQKLLDLVFAVFNLKIQRIGLFEEEVKNGL